MNKRIVLTFLICLITSMLFATGQIESTISVVQEWPTKPINLIVPWNPGDGTDIAARAYAQALQNVTGQSVVVINKPGGSGSIGTLYASKQPADGYNILFSPETPGTFQVMGISDVSFDSFDGIMMLCEDTKFIVVKGDAPYRSIEDLIKAIKEDPGKIKLAYSAPGASGHIQGLILEALGLKTSMTPFGGGLAGLTAVMGGQVDFTFANGVTILGYVASGDIRALAAYTDQRSPAFPNVPAFTEILPESKKYLPLGFPYSVLVPKGTDPAIIDKIIEYSKKAIEDPAWKNFITQRPTYKTLYEYVGPKAVNEYWTRWMSIANWLLYDAGVTKYSPEKFGIKRIN